MHFFFSPTFNQITVTMDNNVTSQLTSISKRRNRDKTCNISGTTNHVQMCVYHSLSGRKSSTLSQDLL